VSEAPNPATGDLTVTFSSGDNAGFTTLLNTPIKVLPQEETSLRLIFPKDLRVSNSRNHSKLSFKK
jgi:hypothetical protein